MSGTVEAHAAPSGRGSVRGTVTATCPSSRKASGLLCEAPEAPSHPQPARLKAATASGASMDRGTSGKLLVASTAAHGRLGIVSTLRDLVEEHAAFESADVEHLHRLAGDWQLISDLSFADLLLWVPLRSGARYISAAHVRPTTAPTADQDDPAAKGASGAQVGS